jgi:hypothetical protein
LLLVLVVVVLGSFGRLHFGHGGGGRAVLRLKLMSRHDEVARLRHLVHERMRM